MRKREESQRESDSRQIWALFHPMTLSLFPSQTGVAWLAHTLLVMRRLLYISSSKYPGKNDISQWNLYEYVRG